MSNILAEVIQTRDAVTGDEFRDHLQNVTFKLSQIKMDLVGSLQSTFVIYDSDIDKVTSWYVEILGIKEKVEDLKTKFHDDKKALIAATDDIELLEDDLQQCDKGIELLAALIQVVKNLERADPVDYYKASKLVNSASQDFESLRESFESIEDHAWVVGIRSKITDLTTDIYENASKELRSVFHFHFGKNMLTINLTRDINQLIETFINVGYCSRVINKLAIDIWQELLVKACSQDFYIEITRKAKNSSATAGIPFQDTDRDGYEIETVPVRDTGLKTGQTGLNITCDNSRMITIKAVRTSTPTSEVQVVFNNIYNVIYVFHQIFQNNADVMSDFSTFLGPKICDELGNKTLKILVLRNADGDVEKAKNNISTIRSFINNFESYLNFIFPDSTIFDEMERDFDSLFLGQVKQDLLAKVRRLVKGNLHDTQEIIWDANAASSVSDDIGGLHRNPYAFPNCVVSKSVVEIVSVLKEHLRRYSDDILMCDAAFSLYLSLVKIPKHESDSGDLVPFSAVLVHNNSHYLAHHATFTFPMTEDKVPELRSKATQAYSFMVRSVRTKLNFLISDAMTAILNNDDESSHTEIDKFLKISSEFVRLHGMLQFVLPSATLARTLATLVDHTVNEMCSKVLTWDDISAACANKLATAFTQFAVETSELFKGEATKPREIDALASKCVSKWNRFRLLTFVLTASMKEIEDKWVGGCGPLSMEFKAEELRKLVRALFQNTDRRAAFLASIK